MSILDRIFETKRQEIADAKRTVSEFQLRDMAASQLLLPFKETLRKSRHPVALIAEVKKASPSKGLIRPNFDPLEIARIYKEVGADCLSVLTDTDYFQGSPAYLQQIKQEIKIPCLRKDFVCDPYQVLEARAWGADAVLLIAASLSKDQLNNLMAQIAELNMDAFVEIHNREEAQVTIDLKADFIGINNRNLDNFSTDLHTSAQLIPEIKAALPGALIVSESALESNQDVEAARLAGADAVLIGTAFCVAPDIESKVREVMAW